MQEFKNVYEELKSRDLIKQITFEDEFKKMVENEKFSVYLGIDPTADSIHIGHFIPLMMMSYFQKCGHTLGRPENPCGSWKVTSNKT